MSVIRLELETKPCVKIGFEFSASVGIKAQNGEDNHVIIQWNEHDLGWDFI